MRTELDISTWNRKSHYSFFKDFDNPFYNICSDVEITELHNYCKNSETSFFLASLFLSIRAANDIEEFRYRIEDDKVFIYERIHPFSTVLNNDDTFSFCELDYNDYFHEFVNKGKKTISDTISKRDLTPKENRKDVIHYTTIPWISLTSLSHARNFGTSDSIPKIVFGKYFSENGKIMMPVCVEVHHSLVDGFHVAKFLESFRKYISNCKTVLDS